MRTVILILVLLPVLAFAPCKMKYKEHYRIVTVQLELLKTNDQNIYKESILDPAPTMNSGDSIVLFFRFDCEFSAKGQKQKNFLCRVV